MIAIGGGGFIPARIIRSFLKVGDTKRNIPIQAIGLSLYEALPGQTTEEVIGEKVIRTQWLDFSTLGSKISHGGLLGRRILVVDEIDDSRKTLSYALKELIQDVNQQLELVQDKTERARLAETTKFGIFVVHNKLKEKAAEIPEGVAYFSGMDIDDVWVDYPWYVFSHPVGLRKTRRGELTGPVVAFGREMVDILQHDELKRQDDAEKAAAGKQ
ncbi:hypothetical protein QFC22_003121 [Naganishia vaughanmartiniae]|uniref:Uncharacterized protein n=1 Tax=Naganishia vaughanmartiniae TaxID=1424756 RepID=A0ACC2XAX6_9TREE|nr:hypothetical protein QFC22_003121 [Naganishia vaughanmartiniae]